MCHATTCDCHERTFQLLDDLQSKIDLERQSDANNLLVLKHQEFNQLILMLDLSAEKVTSSMHIEPYLTCTQLFLGCFCSSAHRPVPADGHSYRGTGGNKIPSAGDGGPSAGTGDYKCPSAADGMPYRLMDTRTGVRAITKAHQRLMGARTYR